MIQWHRSYQETCVCNNANNKIKSDAKLIDAHMKPIIEYYNNQYTPKNAKAQFGSYIYGIKIKNI